MTQKEFAILASGTYQSLLQDNLHRDPGEFALSLKEKNFPPSVLATQLKYLQKSQSKLPSYFAHHCLFLPKAYEQASSEATAKHRGYAGNSCLDLTCGLGVDSLYLAKSFERVDAVEADLLLFQLTTHNFQKMGIQNVSLFHRKAEDFIAALPKDAYDLVYIDPDRRSDAGKRLIRLDESQPNVVQLSPHLLKISPRLVVKASPLLDLTEARRLFPTLSRLSIASVKNEVKEILLELTREEVPKVDTEILIHHSGEVQKYSFPPSGDSPRPPISPVTSPVQYVYEPDVAFYKGQCTQELFQQYFPKLRGAMNHKEGYFFSDTLGEVSSFPGRVFECIGPLPPQIPKVKKYLKQQGIRQIHVSRRHFPDSAAKIARKLSMVAGGQEYLLFTEFPTKDFRAFHLRRIK